MVFLFIRWRYQVIWDGIGEILKRVISRGVRRVYCNKRRNGRCYSGRASAPKVLVGEKVYFITEAEMEDLKRYVSSMTVLHHFFSVILNSRKGSKMFNIVGETWNPITGCLHYCKYCWARQLALTKLKNTRRYRDGFKPRLNEEELRKSFKGGVVVARALYFRYFGNFENLTGFPFTPSWVCIWSGAFRVSMEPRDPTSQG